MWRRMTATMLLVTVAPEEPAVTFSHNGQRHTKTGKKGEVLTLP
jgi:hypothetical protein